jgi:hypothetical protein
VAPSPNVGWFGRAGRVLSRPAGLIVICSLLAVDCEEEAEPTWVQFNGSDDSLIITVGIEDELDPVSCDLTSDVVANVVGTATVTPGGGPFGTEHEIRIEIGDEWEHEVGRVTVRTDSGERGTDEYELDSDSSDEGSYGLTIISVGDEGEQRDDTLTFRLWYDSQDSASGDTGS